MNAPQPLTMSARDRWLALIAALLGWMFDGAEMGLFAMVGRGAVRNLLTRDGTPPPEDQIALYFAVITAIFLVGAATGGVLFGWLGDRLGRVRAMAFSVAVYAIFTGVCGLATDVYQLGALRFIASLGMGGEWALGVALVMEVWPNRSRGFMAGLIGAAANVGYLLVGMLGLALNSVLQGLETLLFDLGLTDATVKSLVAEKGWRLMMIAGALPAMLTFFIRWFVPESRRWTEEKAKGATSHWATADLLSVLVGALGPALMIALWVVPLPLSGGALIAARGAGVVIALALVSVGYLFPVYRFMKRLEANSPGVQSPAQTQQTLNRMLLAALLSGTALLGTWGGSQWAPTWADQLAQEAEKTMFAAYENTGLSTKDLPPRPPAREYTQCALAIGAILGAMLATVAGDMLGRRASYALLCILALGANLYLFLGHNTYGPSLLFASFLSGVCTASFYGWLPLYLPELFGTRVRATAQGFGFNFGRILAAVGTLQAAALFKTTFQFGGVTLPPGYPSTCSILSLVYLAGLVIIYFAPETKGKPLPD